MMQSRWLMVFSSAHRALCKLPSKKFRGLVYNCGICADSHEARVRNLMDVNNLHAQHRKTLSRCVFRTMEPAIEINNYNANNITQEPYTEPSSIFTNYYFSFWRYS